MGQLIFSSIPNSIEGYFDQKQELLKLDVPCAQDKRKKGKNLEFFPEKLRLALFFKADAVGLSGRDTCADLSA